MKNLTVLLVIFGLSTSFASVESTVQANKKVVEAFYDLAFNKHKSTEAMNLFTGDKYIQHNPYAGDGKQPFKEFFNDYYKNNPEASVQIKRIIAYGKLVVVHAHSKQNNTDRGAAVVDIFRVEKGKIVEHWDVVQPIPEKSANNNTMF